MIGLWITMQATEELKPINEARVAAGLKPLDVADYFKKTQNLKVPPGTEWYAAAKKHLLMDAQAEAAALRAIPKGSVTGVVEDIIGGIGKKVGTGAAAAGISLEKLRQRKNEMAAKEAASEAMKLNVQTSKMSPWGVLGGALDVAGGALSVYEMHRRASEDANRTAQARQRLVEDEFKRTGNFPYAKSTYEEMASRIPGYASGLASAASFGAYDAFGPSLEKASNDYTDFMTNGLLNLQRQANEKR